MKKAGGKPIIKIRNLVKKYKRATVNAVDDISFEINQGEFFALLGPNGAGKTTTISIISTTLSKTSGKVYIDGLDLDKNPSKIRNLIGVIFQNPSLDQNLTAEENIRFHAVLYGLYNFQPVYSWMPEIYKKKIMQLSDLLELKNDIFKPIKTYSGGMKRKLEIIRSLIHDPKILILDEPTSGLDPLARKNLWQYIWETQKKHNMTILLTTHYLEEAEYADNICVVNNGKIISYGSPDKIKANLIEEYILVDAVDRETLIGELRRYNMPFELGQSIKIIVKKNTAQEIIRKIKTNLSQLKIHTPSLEEAYLELISKDHET
ncbi:MAG: ABC transporter, ATP-binding protein [Parcubacteria group bacterium GW2011_GWA2_31_28]|nr:MAG: ABC transporter, ATP-binding protein [Parcubacteria group bacterium GW2011_GWA2_31_28]